MLTGCSDQCCAGRLLEVVEVAVVVVLPFLHRYLLAVAVGEAVEVEQHYISVPWGENECPHTSCNVSSSCLLYQR